MPWLFGAELSLVIFQWSKVEQLLLILLVLLCSLAHSTGSGLLVPNKLGTSVVETGQPSAPRKEALRSNFLWEAKAIKHTQWRQCPREVEAHSLSLPSCLQSLSQAPSAFFHSLRSLSSSCLLLILSFTFPPFLTPAFSFRQATQ